MKKRLKSAVALRESKREKKSLEDKLDDVRQSTTASRKRASQATSKKKRGRKKSQLKKTRMRTSQRWRYATHVDRPTTAFLAQSSAMPPRRGRHRQAVSASLRRKKSRAQASKAKRRTNLKEQLREANGGIDPPFLPSGNPKQNFSIYGVTQSQLSDPWRMELLRARCRMVA